MNIRQGAIKEADPLTGNNPFVQSVGAKALRKLAMQRDRSHGVWFGLGMSGLVGWSVAVPTLLGTTLGGWLDGRYPSSYSWTLMLMVIGLAIGCGNAWHWLAQQHAAMSDQDSKGQNE